MTQQKKHHDQDPTVRPSLALYLRHLTSSFLCCWKSLLCFLGGFAETSDAVYLVRTE